MLWPNGTTKRPTVTSPFGPRRAPIPGASTFHRGVDVVGFREVRAIADGVVRVVGTPRGWSRGGIQVWVQHDGFFTRCLHLASTTVRVGQTVRAGDVLGVMGATGARDVHLHLEVTPGTVHYGNSGQVDPVPFITARIATPAGGASTTSSPEEDDMDCMILINSKIYALNAGYIKHCDSVEQVREALARGVKQHDYTGPDRLAAWVRALDFYGIPRQVLDPHGLVINPETGKAENGGMWSWERGNRALLTQLLKKSA